MDKKKQTKKIILSSVIFIFVMYLILPPHNKFAQIGYLYNNYTYHTSSKDLNRMPEYVFHRNNAVYLARMGSKYPSLKEIDKAIETMPENMDEIDVLRLYADRAKLRIYYKDYKGALDDFLRIPSPNMTESLKIAMLLKEQGKNKMSVSYCNRIIDMDIRAYAGYACIADVYAGIGKYDASVMIYDLLIDRVPNKAKYYADRAMYKKAAGDIQGYENDLKEAKELYPLVDLDSSITYDSIHPKSLDLSII